MSNLKKILPRPLLVVVIVFGINLQSCIYSFKSGSTGEAKTISIQNFFNEAGGGPPNLNQTFTEKLKSYYQDNSRLLLLKNGGDWQLEGKITKYAVSPIAPKQGESTSLNRLIIEVNATFINTLNTDNNFTQNFSFYSDFPSEQSITQVENQLIEEILNQIVFDIFTKTTSDW